MLSDGTRTVELYLIQGNMHHDGIIMAYLPKEKILTAAHLSRRRRQRRTEPDRTAHRAPLNEPAGNFAAAR